MPGDFLGRSSETKLVRFYSSISVPTNGANGVDDCLEAAPRLHLPVGKIENDWARAPNGCMKGLALKANLWFPTSLSLRLGKML